MSDFFDGYKVMMTKKKISKVCKHFTQKVDMFMDLMKV